MLDSGSLVVILTLYRFLAKLTQQLNKTLS